MAYTGRLANPNARPGNLVLGRSVLAPASSGPSIDVPTTVTLDPHLTTVAMAPRTTTVVVAPRRTTVEVDG